MQQIYLLPVKGIPKKFNSILICTCFGIDWMTRVDDWLDEGSHYQVTIIIMARRYRYKETGSRSVGM